MTALVRRRLVSLPIVLFGMSLITFALTHIVPGDPARRLFSPATVELTVAAMLIVVVLGLPLGLLAGLLRGRLPDHLIRLFSIGAVSMPVFWLGIILQII